jgi:hypothetical protein|tara:strand:+ start:4609 stop:4800 length:192 start_codon:yes stop_codon:yes gene_type:complete
VLRDLAKPRILGCLHGEQPLPLLFKGLTATENITPADQAMVLKPTDRSTLSVSLGVLGGAAGP